MLSLLLPAAWATPCEIPFTEDDLGVLVRKAKAALEADDIDAHALITAELTERVPCLVGQLPSRPWADYLVTVAMARFTRETPNWEQPLSVALDLVPEHPDVPSFVLSDYQAPPPPTGPTVPLAPGQLFVLDGKVVLGEVPALDGVHIVQAVVDGEWRSRWLVGPMPADFLPARGVESPSIPRPTKDRSSFNWGTAGIGVGAGSWQQKTFDSRIRARSETGLALRLGSHGQQAFGGPAGAFWTASFDLQSARGVDGDGQLVPFGHAFVGLSLFQPLSIWVGGGISTVRAEERPTDAGVEKVLVVPHYLLGLSFARPAFDLGLAGGFGIPTRTPGNPEAPNRGWGSHLVARGGVKVASLGSMGLRLGADLTLSTAGLGDQGDAQKERELLATASTWRTAIHVGVRW